MTLSKRNTVKRLSPTRVCWGFLVLALALLWVVQRRIEKEQGAYAKISDVLYIPSGTMLRRLSLGNEGLLADIYWTRVVQYFGRHQMQSAGGRFELLAPLLRITTDLDPHLLIAYRFGSIFLMGSSQRGKGQPDAALEILRRGIVANPDYWRLWQDLGFIYYWELKDYKTASRIFAVGGNRPGAEYWMKALAGTIAAKGGDLETSYFLWSQVYRDAVTEDARRTAADHLAAITALKQMEKLNQALAAYKLKSGTEAHSFAEVYASGLLRSLPKDPSGVPYVVGPNGQAEPGPGTQVNLALLRY